MELKEIKGLGEVALKKLAKAGVESVMDLACFFPAKYIDARTINGFETYTEGETVVLRGILKSVELKRARSLSFVKTEFESTTAPSTTSLSATTSSLTPSTRTTPSTAPSTPQTATTTPKTRYTAVFFNQPFIFRAIKKGQEYAITGKIRINKPNNSFEVVAPKLIPLARIRPIIPIYKSIGISATILENAIKTALNAIKIASAFTQNTQNQHNLMDTKTAIHTLHFPTDFDQLIKAKTSLSLENIAVYIHSYNSIKRKNIAKNKDFLYKNTQIHPNLDDFFGFSLTPDQQKAISKIQELMTKPEAMNVLLQGDVGSGKTAVCFYASLLASKNGYQTAFMTPTELLARQHYQNAQKLFQNQGIEVVILTGSMTAKEQSEAKQKIASGQAKIAIGTHSLFQKGVKFANLSLVITDEQHRFGVNQRGALENKGVTPDCIVVTATPIPRTLSLVIYGDLEPIIIKDKPKNKAKITTCFVDSKVEEMYEYLLKKAKIGEQSYIVCPRVKENPDDEDEIDQTEPETDSITELVTAQGLLKKLKNSPLKDHVGLLHGQMKEGEKSQIMADFTSGKTKILVTTTVVEVGIDVPKATTIVIHNATRYGLSQLHQLRGRVGRGGIDGYCFLVINSSNCERLEFFKTCDDGFLLAEKDLEIRGAGDFLGHRQHGLSLTFSGQKLTTQMLLKAKELSDFVQIHSGINQPFVHKSKSYFKDLTLN